MCDPTAIALGAQAGQMVQGEQQAQATYAYDKQNQKIGTTFAYQDATAQYGALAARRDQDRQAAADSLWDFSQDAIARASAARTAGLEGGGAGGSLSAYVQDYTNSRLRAERTTARNEAFADAQFVRDSEGVRQGLHRTLFSLVPRPDMSMRAAFRGQEKNALKAGAWLGFGF